MPELSYGPKRPDDDGNGRQKGRNVKVLEMIGFSIAVILICIGLLGFMMGGFKFPNEGAPKGAHKR
jgi:hypothetical protein